MSLKNTWVTGETYAASDQNAVATAVNANTGARPAFGAFASLPAAGNAGAEYTCTDVGLRLRDNGTTWDRIWGGPLNAFTAPPTSGLSTTTMGTASFAADKDARLLTCPSSAGDNWRIEYATLSPTSGYTATAFVDVSVLAGNYLYFGPVLYNSTSGAFIALSIGFDSTSLGGWGLKCDKWTNVTSFNAFYKTIALTALGGLPNWLRFRDDSSNRFAEYSTNGVDWVTAFSVGRTDFITPSHVGWGGSNSGGATAKARLRSFKVTTP